MIHIVVRVTDENKDWIRNLDAWGDAKTPPRVFPSSPTSSTAACAKLVFDDIDIGAPADPEDVDYPKAIELLEAGELDAAFLSAGIPTEAVEELLAHKHFELISISPKIVERIASGGHGLEAFEIPANTYSGQSEAIRTLKSPVFLMCHEQMHHRIATRALMALFDNMEDLLRAHTTVQDIRLNTAFDPPAGYELHKGALRFQRAQGKALWIATAGLGGMYFIVGRRLQRLMRPLDLEPYVLHTNGSVQNARYLEDEPNRADEQGHIVALMQNDVAVVARYGRSQAIYGMDLTDELNLRPNRGLCRLAVLHLEVVHVVVRRDALKARPTNGEPPTVKSLDGLVVCVGPRGGGTHAIATAVLRAHKLKVQQRYLSYAMMVERLKSGEIDAGIFVTQVPARFYDAVLTNPEFQLLPMTPRAQAGVVGHRAVFETASIPSTTYLCQLPGETPIATIATRSALVCRHDLPDDQAYEVTRAMFQGAAILDLEGGRKQLARDLESVPLHPGARRYYEEAGLLPKPPTTDWLGLLTRIFSLIAVLLAAYRGLLAFRWRRTKYDFVARIMNVDTAFEARSPVAELLALRATIDTRLTLRWWQRGRVDRPRWNALRALIGTRIDDARDFRQRGYVREIVDGTDAGERITDDLRCGELTPGQAGQLRAMLAEQLSR